MAQTMKHCAACGAEIAKSAKTCPSCGAKNKKPIYLRPWFILLAVILILGAIGSSGSSDEDGNTPSSPNSSMQAGVSSSVQTQLEPEVVYIPYSVDQMMDDLDNNALKAAKTYDDQYVEITGELAVIDSSGDYISLHPANGGYHIFGVQCYIKTETQLERIMEMDVGDIVTLRGKITEVGEVIGYAMNIDSIVN